MEEFDMAFILIISVQTKKKSRLQRIPSKGIHFCPKNVIYESAPNVVAIDEIW